ncbi:inositol monophosphatase [Plantactinospora sp. KLBMP9567]|uniref:inositol monophosphatase family protein n=1 Tax=Plantactinospora sp. KLBMP9567 TaxID=3085900 RepID=UPI0029816B21|nr:inositol monophosphatase [Plantactinospora sp. KLBMP9567]MDW5328882.1 inositol monophosphatase [Plantactinospora sp. KLBMP9567]
MTDLGAAVTIRSNVDRCPWDTDDVPTLLHAAVSASHRAGDYVLRQFRKQVRVRHKITPGVAGSPATDLVSECDVYAEEIIRKTLNSAFPNCGVIGEESGPHGNGDLRWYVDPIDGTYNFLRGLPLFCISIGYEVGGVPLGGCVYDPVGGETFAAHCDEFRLDGWRLPLAGRSPVGPPLVLTDVPNGGPAFHPGDGRLIGDVLHHAELRRIGSSALALAWTAAGRADMALNTNVYAWDVAAGRALVTAAGGRFAAFPDPVPTDCRGSFVAWLPSADRLAERVLEWMDVATERGRS